MKEEMRKKKKKKKEKDTQKDFLKKCQKNQTFFNICLCHFGLFCSTDSNKSENKRN